MNQRLVTGYAVRIERAHILDRLNDVGFAVPVWPDQQINPWLELNFRIFVITKVDKGEVFYKHPSPLTNNL
jgi:hypothetical protein